MFSMPILDVAIGLSFVYLLLGLICTTVTEMIASWRKTRANFLDRGIARLLGGDAELKAKLYNHPLIRALVPSDKHICPSYIPADKFATALLDVLSGAGKSLADVAAVQEGAQATGNASLQGSLNALIDSAQRSGVPLHKALETWFEEGMDRVSGWYKRNAQWNALLLAFLITLVLNADTVLIARTLWTNPVVRAAVVEEARVRADKELPLVEYDKPEDATESTPIKQGDQALSDTERKLLGDLTGWEQDWSQRNNQAFPKWLGGEVFAHSIGWILTALAVSLGAPFWFDTLNRFMNIRNAGRAPDEPRDKARGT
jgi:hypothetical protein